MGNEDIYQDFIIELWKHPRNHGTIKKPDIVSEIDNETCGDRIRLFLKFKGKTVDEAKFTGSGCAISQASASLVTGMLVGKTRDALKTISKDDILALLKIDLSKNPSRMRCALLPLAALKKALQPDRR